MEYSMRNKFLHNPELEGDAFFWEAGPVGILLAHGYSATTVDVRPLAQNLHDHGYTVAGPLLPGHGTQPADLNRVRWQDWVAEGEKTYQQLKQRCEKVFVGGESMGAMVALQLASDHPEAAGILCYAPAIKLTMTSFDMIKLNLAAPFLEQIPRDSLDCSDKWQGYPGLPLKGASQLLRMQKATLAKLPKIRQPIIIFQGRKDTTVAADAGEIILQGIKSSVKELHWLEKSTHAIPLDQEIELVTKLSVDFIEKQKA
jgi:carboxylesterase